MGEKSHSEHHFFPSGAKPLSTVKQGEERGPSTAFLGGAGDTVAQETWQRLAMLGVASSARRPAGRRAWEDSKVAEIRLGS